MAIPQSFLLGLLVVLGSLVRFEPTMACDEKVPSSFNRSTFPEGFIFGASSSAYQYEGAANKCGRGPSIWDFFTHETPARTADGSNGDVAVDFYHRYKKDVTLLEKMNMDAFRFSISWSRILPYGKRSVGVNKHGIKFYNNLINELLSKGLQPFVTLFHWDLPQALEDEYNGFLHHRIVDDFKDFADLCFEEFGDRVKHWITLNEPLEFSSSGYDSGISAPGRCSKWVNKRCRAGNSSTEPYKVSHHMLLAHAEAVNVYKKKYQKSQKGKIGIVLNTAWLEPYSNTTADQEAVKRGLDFTFGWFMNPLTYGDYPQIMRTIVGERLPKFNQNQSMMIKGSFDFLGLNYYTSAYATNASNESVDPKYFRYQTDSHVNTTYVNSTGHLIGPAAGSNWLHIYPKGIRYILNYTKDTYNNPTIYITENGVDEINNCTLPIKEALKDPIRIDYHRRHLWNVHKSMREYGVDVKGYFVWSLLDDFELSSGYTVRFGLYYIDYDNCLKRYAEFNNCLKRYPKTSVKWFEKFLEKSTYFHDRSRWNRSVGLFNTTWSEQELFDDDM